MADLQSYTEPANGVPYYLSDADGTYQDADGNYDPYSSDPQSPPDLTGNASQSLATASGNAGTQGYGGSGSGSSSTTSGNLGLINTIGQWGTNLALIASGQSGQINPSTGVTQIQGAKTTAVTGVASSISSSTLLIGLIVIVAAAYVVTRKEA